MAMYPQRVCRRSGVFHTDRLEASLERMADLGKIFRVQGRFGPGAPGARSIWAVCTGCNVLDALCIRVQYPSCLIHSGAMPCLHGPSCLVHPGVWMRENTYMLLPRAHMIKVVCVCVHDRSTYFLLRKGLPVCPFVI